MKFVDWVKGWHLASVIVVVVIGTFVVLRLLDRSTDTTDIESDIQSQIATKFGEQITVTSVECPDTVEWDPNEEFHCFAYDADNNSIRITVHMESKNGDYTWAVE